MRRRGHPLRWPISIGLAVGLFLAGALLTPRSWFDHFLAPRPLRERSTAASSRPWLLLLPPPEIVVARTPRKPEEVHEEPPAPAPAPDWWTRGWRVRVATQGAQALRPAPTDSVSILLSALGVGRDPLTRSRPDSLLAARLLLMQRADALRMDELKPYFIAASRAAAYRDLQSRVAQMYDDFLRQEIIVPD